MRDIFEAELHQLGEDLVAMAGRVKKAVATAGDALLSGDLALAESVIADDLAIDDLNRELDERCIRLLAQQQPVATDLRVIVSALRIASSLERMGDLARHVAQVARGRYPEPAVPGPVRDTFIAMDAAAVRVAEQVVALLSTRDLSIAAAVERDDDLLDELHGSTFASQLGGEWQGSPQETVDVTLLARYYERFGDHAVSVARRIVYLVTGVASDDSTERTTV
ncbi:MAG: phosphate signaling complex protein PhoU [Actinobacteria bacterium]|nr:phosphate signaling complex protein PhoU [Actinomycetota bacterium]MCG2800066.1 phosphate signaling complex protein PhoU [Cellulomonas sp.]